MSNSDHPMIGSVFQKQVLEWFQKEYGIEFELEKKIPIGYPAKDHKFDIVDTAGKIAIECKRYTWTETGNVPSAKMGFTNEAAFYLSFLPDRYEKYIVMLKSRHPKRNESLAEYYFKTNHHLLGKIKVAEYDPERNELRVVGQNDFTKKKEYEQAKVIYEELLKEYPSYRRQIEMEWKEEPTLENMEELKGIAEAFF